MTKRRYSIADARANLASVVGEAEAGMDVELTRRGEAIAVLVSRRRYDLMRGGEGDFAKAYEGFRARFEPSEGGVDDEALEGLRDRRPSRVVDL